MYRFWQTVMIAATLCASQLHAGTIDLQLTRVSDRTGVVDITNAGDGTGRLFLLERSGRVFLVDGDVEHEVPFLDIRNKVRSVGSEQGLLSIAFAPDYRVSGLFYVWYTNLFGDTVIERYRAGQDPDQANAGSGEIVLGVPQPFSNHNGGRLRFGPDGMLYLGLGDGGGSFDPEGNGQAATTLLGKLIRIDVDPVHGTYAIPPDNPFVNTDFFQDEIWALGLRNPWRISFDSLTGDLYIADVGQNQREEVNFQPPSSPGGENYGWDIMEGSECVSVGCDQSGLTLPVTEYSHGQGCSVTGGEVYRGRAYPGLVGSYLFADFCSGQIWSLVRSGQQWQTTELANTNFQITTFGLGEDGGLYLSARSSGIYLISDGPAQPEPEFQINPRLNDSWFNPATPGQGFFVTVFEDSGMVFLAWFTYDTERPPANVEAVLGDPGHRWLTAFGPYDGDTATLDIELTQGGIFDQGFPMPTQSGDGQIFLEFDDCNRGRVIFEVSSAGETGTIPIQRISDDNVPSCEVHTHATY